VGNLELRVPQYREGRFSTELFERYQLAEKSLVATLVEMYVQGVSLRSVKAVTEELCGQCFSASAISAVLKRLDAELKASPYSSSRPIGCHCMAPHTPTHLPGGRAAIDIS
jgi:putative transposase